MGSGRIDCSCGCDGDGFAHLLNTAPTASGAMARELAAVEAAEGPASVCAFRATHRIRWTVRGVVEHDDVMLIGSVAYTREDLIAGRAASYSLGIRGLTDEWYCDDAPLADTVDTYSTEVL